MRAALTTCAIFIAKSSNVAFRHTTFWRYVITLFHFTAVCLLHAGTDSPPSSQECNRAKHYSKHPNKVKIHPATQKFLPDFARKCTDADALLFQPHITVKLGKAALSSHHDAFKLITTKIKSSTLYTKSEREAVGRLWTEFMVPWFDLPAHWVLDEARESFRGKVGANVVKCEFYSGILILPCEMNA